MQYQYEEEVDKELQIAIAESMGSNHETQVSLVTYDRRHNHHKRHAINSNARLTDVPDDVLLHIFKMIIDDDCSWGKLSRVCQNFCDVVKQYRTKTYEIKSYDFNLKRPALVIQQEFYQGFENEYYLDLKMPHKNYVTVFKDNVSECRIIWLKICVDPIRLLLYPGDCSYTKHVTVSGGCRCGYRSGKFVFEIDRISYGRVCFTGECAKAPAKIDLRGTPFCLTNYIADTSTRRTKFKNRDQSVSILCGDMTDNTMNVIPLKLIHQDLVYAIQSEQEEKLTWQEKIQLNFLQAEENENLRSAMDENEDDEEYEIEIDSDNSDDLQSDESIELDE